MSGGRTQVLVLIDLVQDADVLLPVIERLAAEPAVRCRVVMTRWLADRAPRIAELLDRAGVRFHALSRARLLAGWGPWLGGVDALLTAAESSASPHRWAHALATRAAARGVATFTLQHGLDHLRTLAPEDGPPLRIASSVLFAWPPEPALPAGLGPDLRARIVCVGRPGALPPPPAPAFDVGVFDNLHARRYTDAIRDAVLGRLLGLIEARPGLRFYVRTHPAGGWLDRAADTLSRFGNVTYVSSAQARADPAPGAAAPSLAARVITTPSTVALDAVQAGRAVAMAVEGGNLYAPLPELAGLDDWIAFADRPAGPDLAAAAFMARHVMPGDASARIVEHLVAVGEKPVRWRPFSGKG